MKLDFTKSLQRDTFIDLSGPAAPKTFSAEYKIIQEDTTYQLQHVVREHLKKGYKLVGGVSVAVTTDDITTFVQALIKP